MADDDAVRANDAGAAGAQAPARPQAPHDPGTGSVPRRPGDEGADRGSADEGPGGHGARGAPGDARTDVVRPDPSVTVLAERYELRGVIGRGGMAEVHRGHDIALDRPVAVKLLPREHQGDPEYGGRLRDEARAAAALNHPNVVSVYDVGVAGQDVFVVMECVEGRTLRDDLRDRGRLPEAEAAAAGAAVCEALAAAHDRGIVHRDVNPGNVMLCDDGSVKLMDFGIARVADVEGFTGTGVVIGTAAYMSPEQVRCESLDGRSDIYALGCTLYELVTAETPFPGPSSVEIASRRLRESPMPPRQLVRTVSRDLNAVILRAMALEPEGRYPDARAMAADLRLLADPTPRGDTGTRTDAGRDAQDPERTEVIDGHRRDREDSRRRRLRERSPGLHAPDEEPSAGEHEPWSMVRRVGVTLIVLAVLAIVAGVALVLLRFG